MQHVISANFPELTASIKFYAINFITTLNTGSAANVADLTGSEGSNSASFLDYAMLNMTVCTMSKHLS